MNILENKLRKLFQIKNDLIPSLYELSKYSVVKHEEIFYEILFLKKIIFSENNFDDNFQRSYYTQQKVHKEMSFILNVCEKHNKLMQSDQFFYIKETLLDRLNEISIYLELYKKMIVKYNFFIRVKNYTILGLLFPFKQKEEI
ncbi:MAG: hypothetical protein GY828_03005 [Candidatus Gracilibacteria bacterium]|nr:hypothetical protein [Candidatus Gracilibacteria bacterium]